MSFLERTLFRLTSNPEAEKAWKEEQKAKKAACEKERSLWTKKESIVKDKDFKTNTLPDDYTYLTKFIKDRILVLKANNLSQEDIDALNAKQETENFNTLMTVHAKRKGFSDQANNGLTVWNKIIKDLKDKGQAVPPAYPKLVARIQEEVEWVPKNQFATGDIYDTEFQNLQTDAGEILKGTGAAMHKPSSGTKAAVDANNAKKENFSVVNMIGQILGIVIQIVTAFLILVFMVYGSSLATNLNLYHSAPYRVLYAIYGFLFFFAVIPYCLLYRGWWKGKKARFYSLIPLVPYHFDNRWAGILFSWMSYKPDDRIEALKEWELEKKTYD